MSRVIVDRSTVTCLLILPTVFQVLINGRVTCPNRVWSCDMLDNQFLGWSCVIFPGSCAVKSCDMLGTGWSRDKSCDGSCDRFPQSRVLEITWLELGLGAVMKRLVIVEWVLGSFGNVFLVGASFAHDSFSLKRRSLSSGESLPRLNDPRPCPQVVPRPRVALISAVGFSSPVSS